MTQAARTGVIQPSAGYNGGRRAVERRGLRDVKGANAFYLSATVRLNDPQRLLLLVGEEAVFGDSK